jgi:general secretion pathway protein A
MEYRQFFGLKKEPFSNDISHRDLMELPDMVGIKSRILYGLEVGGFVLITGEVGSGKSTSLRWSMSSFHPSEVLIAQVVGQSGHLGEILKSIALAIGVPAESASRTKLMNELKSAIREIVTARKQKVLIVIDECHLLRSEVFAELHTLTQYDLDSKNMATVVMCGQTSLIDKLSLRSSAPLTSRVIAKTHLQPLDRKLLAEYIVHHLKVAGCKHNLFDEAAMTAIYQGSGGILRKANFLARGGLMAACAQKEQTVNAEHIRIASSELL